MAGKGEIKKAVIALGGNAIIREGEEGTIAQQFKNTRMSLVGVVELIKGRVGSPFDTWQRPSGGKPRYL